MLPWRILERSFRSLVTHGTLEVVTSDGRIFKVGDGATPKVGIRFRDAGAEWALCLDPELKLGELYTDGRLLIERGSFYEFLHLVLQDSHGELDAVSFQWVRRLLDIGRRIARRNDPSRSRQNVAHHYDIDRRLYELFLDGDLQYSCAYFDTPDVGLEEAQAAKKRHIMAKLLVEPGQSILDIGSGWGGLAISLAENAAAGQVRGITLSEEQLGVSRQRAAKRSFGDRVTFALEDYRATRGSFDRIVSVGMFEHVGVHSYGVYFQTCRRLLRDDGVMLLHTIGRTGRTYPINAWMKRYIFPGAHLPTLSEMTSAVESSGLIVTDIEVLRLHYAYTLRAWRERFVDHWADAKRLYDERFCRMWEAYLSMCEAAFRFEDLVVYQVQLACRKDTVPITRNYIAESKNRADGRGQPKSAP